MRVQPVRVRTSGAWARRRMATALLAVGCLVALGGCEVEKRRLGAAAPTSAPTGIADERAQFYSSNRYEVSEGGRMFRWYGCDGCHTDPAAGYLHLGDDKWRRGGSVPQIYAVIASGAPGMPAYAARLTPEQIWRIAGYVHGQHQLKPEQRRRGAQALEGEPSGTDWKGPL